MRIVSEGEKDLFAFTTVLPFATHGSLDAVKSILRDLSLEIGKLDQNGETATIMRSCINGDEVQVVGLFLHGRFVNLPLTLIPTLHKQLHEDLIWASEQETKAALSTDKKIFGSMEYLLLISQCHRPEAGSASSDITSDSSVMFDNFEDEIYFQESLASVMFKPTCAGGGATFGAAIVPVSSLPLVISSLQTMLVPDAK
jgi:protein BCP1